MRDKKINNFKLITSTSIEKLYCGQLVISFFNTPNYQRIGIIININFDCNNPYKIKWLNNEWGEKMNIYSGSDLTLYDTYYLE